MMNVGNAGQKPNDPFAGQTRHFGQTPPVIKREATKPAAGGAVDANKTPVQAGEAKPAPTTGEPKPPAKIGNLMSFVKNFSESVDLKENGNIDIKVNALNIVKEMVTKQADKSTNKNYQDNLKILGLTSELDKTITPKNSHLHYFALGSALKNEPINSTDADKIKSFKTGIPPEDFMNFNEKLFGKDFINQLIDSTNIPDTEKKQFKDLMAEYYKISDQYVKLSPTDITNLTEQLAGNDKSKNKYTQAQWAALPEMAKKKEIVEQNNVNKARDTLSTEQQEKFDKLSPDDQRDKMKQMLKTDNLADPAITDKLNDTSMQDALRKGYDKLNDAQRNSEDERFNIQNNAGKSAIERMTKYFTSEQEGIQAQASGMGKMMQGLMGLADMMSKMRQSIMDRTNQRVANKEHAKERQEKQQKQNSGWGATGG